MSQKMVPDMGKELKDLKTGKMVTLTFIQMKYFQTYDMDDTNALWLVKKLT